MATKARIVIARLRKVFQSKNERLTQQTLQDEQQFLQLDRQAFALYEKGNFIEAITIYEQLVALIISCKNQIDLESCFPRLVNIIYDLANTYYMIGICYVKLENFILAKRCFDLAIQENPEYQELITQDATIRNDTITSQAKLTF